jgi:hypothetical protein
MEPDRISEAITQFETGAPPALASLAGYIARVDAAAALLSAAHPTRPPPRRRPGRRRVTTTWFGTLVGSALDRTSEVLAALDRPSPATEYAAEEGAAFALLADLTPFKPQLMALHRTDSARALRELAIQLRATQAQFASAADMLASPADPAALDDAGRFLAARDALLREAGGALSLTEAAQALGVTRQALHKRIHAGSALGMMVDGTIVVPSVQFVQAGAKRTIVAGLDGVVKPFLASGAGPWAALQFLIEPDPNLGCPPVEALRADRSEDVTRAAQARLHLDEGERLQENS